MIAFQISVNGEEVCAVGLAGLFAVTVSRVGKAPRQENICPCPAPAGPLGGSQSRFRHNRTVQTTEQARAKPTTTPHFD
jgi:hypothetical protein